MAYRSIPEATRLRVIEMYQAGEKTAKITDETGVPRPTIYWILEQAGVAPSRTTVRRKAPRTNTELDQALKWTQNALGLLHTENVELRSIIKAQQETIDTLVRKLP